jgi:hypothetical protein
MKKSLLLLIALMLTLASFSVHAAQPPLCDKYCPTGDDGDLCTCPEWTDERVEVATCGTWDTYYGCWYW